MISFKNNTIGFFIGCMFLKTSKEGKALQIKEYMKSKTHKFQK